MDAVPTAVFKYLASGESGLESPDLVICYLMREPDWINFLTFRISFRLCVSPQRVYLVGQIIREMHQLFYDVFPIFGGRAKAGAQFRSDLFHLTPSFLIQYAHGIKHVCVNKPQQRLSIVAINNLVLRLTTL